MPLSHLIETFSSAAFWDCVAGTLVLVAGIVGFSALAAFVWGRLSP